MRNRKVRAKSAVKPQRKQLSGLLLHALSRSKNRIGEPCIQPRYYAATLSSFSAPRITIFSASSGRALWRSFASFHGARIHTSRSSSVVRITGIALRWIGSTKAFGAVVRKT